MSPRFEIARKRTRLGVLSEDEIHELLECGFLLPTDFFRPERARKWKPLKELAPQTGLSNSLFKTARNTVSSAAAVMSSATSSVRKQVLTLAGVGKTTVTHSAERILNQFMPQIQKVVARQLAIGSTKVVEAVHDDEFMKKFFGAVYDCLPKPVYRFVQEQQFLQFCLDHRRKLLGMKEEVTNVAMNPNVARLSP
jgi:hypothetical protein